MSDGEYAGALLRFLRLQACLTPDEVATAAETSVAYLMAVEEGALPVSQPFARHVADVIAGRLLAVEPLARAAPPAPPPEERAEPA